MQEETTEIIQSQTGMAALAGAEADIRVGTARRFPRAVKKALAELEAAVLSSQEAAEECFYHLERKQRNPNGKDEIKIIEGPSIRFAEALVAFWGNTMVDSGVAEIGEKYATAYGTVWDLERNNFERIVVKKRITTKSGYRYSEDMAVTAANAARSIAKREAVLKAIPKIYWWPIFEKAREAAIGKSIDLPVRRQKVVEYFQKIGVGVDRILAKMGREKIEDLTSEDIFRLKGSAAAIRDGDAVLEEVFPPIGQEKPGQEAAGDQTRRILDKMKGGEQPAESAPLTVNGETGASTPEEARKDLGIDHERSNQEQAQMSLEAQTTKKEKGEKK